ncbi:MAG TPA: alpha/beta hydrolase [Gemmatimonadaceae bacterium]|jgi:acetyl esterase/lipase|nr:alpha/beta hydrolase [Gemmatimonadaceae bacterium]
MRSWTNVGLALSLAVALVPAPSAAQGGGIRAAIERRRAARQAGGGLDDGADAPGRATIPANVRVVHDVAYGSAAKQRFDVYIPAGARNAPVVFLVHGGGWRTGDKAGRAVVENKVAHWSRAGVIVVSVNYRLLPDADPLEQARDVARALAAAQTRLASWGGDPARVVLVGHSAGAHLVALLDADPALAASLGAKPWIGTIILDSAVLDVPPFMSHPHLPLYTHAFGSDTALWRAASPYDHLHAGMTPMLVVCSSQRRESCPASMRFVAKAKQFGVRAEVLTQAKSHREINEQLGIAGPYTDAVDRFLSSLDSGLARALGAAR